MRRRLRKKLRMGEFRELGFMLGFHLQDDWEESTRDRFIYSFLDDCVEPQGLGFLGSGRYDWTGFVRTLAGGTVTEAERRAVLGWLRSHEGISAARAGPLIDAWHAPARDYEPPAG